MTWLADLLLFLLLWLGGYAVYLAFNHGVAPNARLQQLLRYLAAAACAVAPFVLTLTTPLQPSLLLILAVAVLWMVTYPLTYHLTHRKAAPDYDHQIDVAFGIYLFGWLATWMLLLPALAFVAGIVAFVLLFLLIAQWVYYAIYDVVIDATGLAPILETDYNEAIEYLRSYPLRRVIGIALAVLLLAALCLYVPLRWRVVPATTAWWQQVLCAALFLFITVYLWKPRHGIFVRTGIASLYLEVKDYVAQNRRYVTEQNRRLADLTATPAGRPLPRPHTIVMVIGESASRDYMSAFTQMDEQTTPWMDSLKADTAHCVLFPHAYSCDIQTVPVLEKALTEYNQYDGGAFFDSCSIVDIAQKLGYRVHWFSNQGYLGAADTPTTLVANTADQAKWTHQELNQVQYDGSLVDFLDEVDPAENNLVVFHFMGSHFNYENRFPPAFRRWGNAHEHEPNYKNTLCYTDHVLQRIFETARQRLNLQAMVYCSDHADVPNRHRVPNFGGFRDTRIPLMVWMGDEYLDSKPERAQALHDNSLCYWTNDLLYDLMCGLMDAQSNRFREENSLASTHYRFTRDTLTAMNTKVRIADDSYPQAFEELKN